MKLFPSQQLTVARFKRAVGVSPRQWTLPVSRRKNSFRWAMRRDAAGVDTGVFLTAEGVPGLQWAHTSALGDFPLDENPDGGIYKGAFMVPVERAKEIFDAMKVEGLGLGQPYGSPTHEA